MDARLSQVEYLAGDYSIADIATFPWVRAYRWVEVPLEEFEHLSRWFEAMAECPAVQRGLQNPKDASDEDRIKGARQILQR